MKTFAFLSVLFLSLSFVGYSQKYPYRISGQVITVENDTLAGYMNWNNKILWIDFFQADKTNNPYLTYFSPEYGITPQIHQFICRFGNIQSIRLTGKNRIELQIKDGHYIELKKGNHNDIGQNIKLVNDSAIFTIPWEQISEVKFMPVSSVKNASLPMPLTGIVQTKQGMYKGAINWNSSQNTFQKPLTGITPFQPNLLFENILQIESYPEKLTLTFQDNTKKSWNKENNIAPWKEIASINMPNIGKVTISSADLKQLELVPQKEISLLSYEDFSSPKRLQGEIETRNGEKIQGILAYDLDESMDIEVLDGKNSDTYYRIPFKYVSTIEPKNYKYSYITLRNGTGLSLGDSPDVSENNSGIIVFRENQNPVYIPWKEIKRITFQ